jgi:hypothetical protein
MNLLELLVEPAPEQRVQYLPQNTASMLGGESVSGKKRKHAKPQQCGNPRTQFAR